MSSHWHGEDGFCRFYHQSFKVYGLESDTVRIASGLEAWRTERARELERVCAKLGLPLNHRVEVRLENGLELRGVLRLVREELWGPKRRERIGLRIDSATFLFADVAAAVRLDEKVDRIPQAARAGGGPAGVKARGTNGGKRRRGAARESSEAVGAASPARMVRDSVAACPAASPPPPRLKSGGAPGWHEAGRRLLRGGGLNGSELPMAEKSDTRKARHSAALQWAHSLNAGIVRARP